MKKQTAYVPVSVEHDMNYVVISPNGNSKIHVEKQENKYVLSEDELKEPFVDFMKFLRDDLHFPILYSNIDDYVEEFLTQKLKQ